MGEYDGDVGEALYVGRYGDVGAFRRWLCGGLTGACVGGVGGVGGVDDDGGRGSDVYGEFVVREAGEDVERVLGEMADQGLRGKMYTREEAMEKYLAEAGYGVGDDGEL